MNRVDENLSFVLQRAVGLIMEMNHEVMTVEHVFCAILLHPVGREIIEALGADVAVLAEATFSYLNRHVPQLEGARRADDNPQQTPAFSRVFGQMVAHARSAQKPTMGIGDFLIALMCETQCYSAKLLESQGVSYEELLRVIVAREDEYDRSDLDDQKEPSNLEKYARNLNKLAKEGKIDPLIGRDDEIRQIAQTLCRRKKNNPILLGEAGVGKSAIVEGLALRIVEGAVPKKLLNSTIYAIDVSSVVAGTKYRGEFETRIKKILSEVEKDENIIIFFDEIHMIVGAGQSHSGSMDFSNILKPLLGSGRLRCIGATTNSEYKTSFDKDKALARRFTQVKVEEPSEDECLQIVKRVAPIYEKHHNVSYEDGALKACVALSAKYISENHLPDKALDLLDMAGSRAQLDYTPRKADSIDLASQSLTSKGASQAEKMKWQEYLQRFFGVRAAPSDKGYASDQVLTPLEIKELDLTRESRIYRANNGEGGASGDFANAAEKQELDSKAALHKVITQSHIEDLMSDITNIPKSTLNSNESTKLKNLEKSLKKRIFSQDAAIEKIVEKITINKAGLGELSRPIASFLFAGPSGVGKTELSKELAKILGIRFERIDMSEYAEAHSISKLIGSPSGYVGYEDGGLLVNKIRTHPHCVLLLDEMEKAHSDVYNILLQIMDSATLTDNQSNKADFKNVILIMTTNAGSKEGNSVGFVDTSTSRSEKAIKDTFSPEFRSRLDAVINFSSLGINDLQRIADKYVSDLNESIKDKNITLKLTAKAAKFLAQNSMDTALGAREIKKLIDSTIKLPLSREILFGKLKKGGVANITVKKDGLTLEAVGDRVVV